MFFRKKATVAKRPVVRTGAAAEAQLKDLRIKARRRLLGALVLVLTAFIVVTWLFDNPVNEPAPTPIVVPEVVHGITAEPSPAAELLQDGFGSGVLANADQADASQQLGDSVASRAEKAQESEADQNIHIAEQQAQEAGAGGSKAQEQSAAAEPKPQAKEVKRSDDGALALALLEGKSPDAAAPSKRADKPGYYLQVAAYTTEQDALKRRDGLRQAGVSDAYVESGQSGGRTVYRLRVGPFVSHDAAQAAQTRLRALGYENGLIAGQ